MEELSAENEGLTMCWVVGQRDLFTSQALPGTPLGPSTFTPFSRVDAVPSFSTETLCSAPGPKRSSRT